MRSRSKRSGNGSKIPITEIARQLNRSRQTIYNELRRGSYLHTVDYQDVVRYSADKGQAIRELASKCKGRRIKTENDADYMDFLEYMILKGKYSPAAALAEARAVGYLLLSQLCGMGERKQ